MAVVVRDSTGDTTRRAALYLRVSTLEQTTVNQERELRAVAARMGCEIVAVRPASAADNDVRSNANVPMASTPVLSCRRTGVRPLIC
jgi:hypothetical protein